jgi:hypothetical protein
MLKLVSDLNNADFSSLLKLEVAPQNRAFWFWRILRLLRVQKGNHVGYVRPELAKKLLKHAPEVFAKTGRRGLAIKAFHQSANELTQRVKTMHERLAGLGILPKPANEFMDVRAQLTDEPLFQINRNLLFGFGLKAWGVHLVIRYENGDFLVAKRSDNPKKVFTYQNCFDVSVGGGKPAGKDPWDHVKVEGGQEAGLAPEIIIPSGNVSVLAYARNVQGSVVDGKYKPAFPFETDGGTSWDEVFYWPVVIGDDVKAKPKDGEVKSFQRMTPVELIHSLKNEPNNWKTNSGVMFLEVLAHDSRYSHEFTAEDRADLDALLIKDPRDPDLRGELKEPSRGQINAKPKFGTLET